LAGEAPSFILTNNSNQLRLLLPEIFASKEEPRKY
jgi:hypothetical protein